MGRPAGFLALATLVVVLSAARADDPPAPAGARARPAVPRVAPHPTAPAPATPTPRPRPAGRITPTPEPTPEPSVAPSVPNGWGGYIGAVGPHVERTLARVRLNTSWRPPAPPPERPPGPGRDPVPGAAARADTLGASTSIPLKLEMGPVTPNPSDGTVRFRLDLPAPGFVRVTILDVAGRLIHETAEQRPAGRHTLAWSSRSSSGTSRAGVYFLRVQVDGRTIATRRTVVVP